MTPVWTWSWTAARPSSYAAVASVRPSAPASVQIARGHLIDHWRVNVTNREAERPYPGTDHDLSASARTSRRSDTRIKSSPG